MKREDKTKHLGPTEWKSTDEGVFRNIHLARTFPLRGLVI